MPITFARGLPSTLVFDLIFRAECGVYKKTRVSYHIGNSYFNEPNRACLCYSKKPYLSYEETTIIISSAERENTAVNNDFRRYRRIYDIKFIPRAM